jgi:hypothetical protein
MLKRQFLALLLAGVALPFCSHAADKPTIKIGYVEGWSDSVATTNVAANIIRNKLGYPVEMVPVAAGIMWQGVARGDLDATLSAWLPTTHCGVVRLIAQGEAGGTRWDEAGSAAPGKRFSQSTAPKYPSFKFCEIVVPAKPEMALLASYLH